MYGKNVVRQIMNDGKTKVIQIWIAGNDREMEAAAQRHHLRVRKTDRKYLTKITGTDRHQGVAAEIEDYQTYTLEEVMAEKKPGEHGLIILLDELEDPHNLGAVLRSADAVGATGVVFKKTHNVGLTPTVAKVSAGAIDTVKCAAVTNLSRACETLKKNGWWIVGTDMDAADYRSLDYDMDTVLIIGNEGKGISRLLREQCDYMVSLPMRGKIQSLNASVSAGILMYEILSKRFPL
jgi:23S rRNA (guanosine2251-2'-O)-methyltransferase